MGLALHERFGVEDYTGIEINFEATEAARVLNPSACIIHEDILKISTEQLGDFDTVVSLSCIDWNVEFDAMLRKAWTLVRRGGSLVVSLRLTEKEGINDIGKSYQFINFDGKREGEIALYVVLNAKEWMNTAKSLPDISYIRAFGYYGAPSVTAVTPYEQVCFAVFALEKTVKPYDSLTLDLFGLPIDLM